MFEPAIKFDRRHAMHILTSVLMLSDSTAARILNETADHGRPHAVSGVIVQRDLEWNSSADIAYWYIGKF